MSGVLMTHLTQPLLPPLLFTRHLKRIKHNFGRHLANNFIGIISPPNFKESRTWKGSPNLIKSVSTCSYTVQMIKRVACMSMGCLVSSPLKIADLLLTILSKDQFETTLDLTSSAFLHFLSHLCANIFTLGHLDPTTSVHFLGLSLPCLLPMSRLGYSCSR